MYVGIHMMRKAFGPNRTYEPLGHLHKKAHAAVVENTQVVESTLQKYNF